MRLRAGLEILLPIQSFRRSSTPDYSHRPDKRPVSRFRGSSRSRGYNAEWDRLAKKYKGSVNGLCEECLRRGDVMTCDVVDHMIPVKAAPDLRLEWNNLDALCHNHHNGIKRQIEKYAAKTGQNTLLPQWMKHPSTRPIHFQIKEKRAADIIGNVIVNSRRPDVQPAKPMVVTPTIEGIEIFDGPGVLSTMTNSTETEVQIFDGAELVYLLRDGQMLQTEIQIFDGLTVKVEKQTSGKVAMAYVQD